MEREERIEAARLELEKVQALVQAQRAKVAIMELSGRTPLVISEAALLLLMISRRAIAVERRYHSMLAAARLLKENEAFMRKRKAMR